MRMPNAEFQMVQMSNANFQIPNGDSLEFGIRHSMLGTFEQEAAEDTENKIRNWDFRFSIVN